MCRVKRAESSPRAARGRHGPPRSARRSGRRRRRPTPPPCSRRARPRPDRARRPGRASWRPRRRPPARRARRAGRGSRARPTARARPAFVVDELVGQHRPAQRTVELGVEHDHRVTVGAGVEPAPHQSRDGMEQHRQVGVIVDRQPRIERPAHHPAQPSDGVRHPAPTPKLGICALVLTGFRAQFPGGTVSRRGGRRGLP